MNYNSLLLEHFFHPRNVKESKVDFDLVYEHGNMKLGQCLNLYVNKAIDGTISDIKFKAYGSPYLISCMSYITENALNKNILELKEVRSQYLIEKFAIIKERQHVAFFIEDALQVLLEVYENDRN